MSDTLIKPDIQDPDLDEENRVSHIVDKDKAADAYVFGTPIEALCGKVFVPSRDPDNYPVCEPCKEVLAEIKHMQNTL